MNKGGLAPTNHCSLARRDFHAGIIGDRCSAIGWRWRDWVAGSKWWPSWSHFWQANRYHKSWHSRSQESSAGPGHAQSTVKTYAEPRSYCFASIKARRPIVRPLIHSRPSAYLVRTPCWAASPPRRMGSRETRVVASSWLSMFTCWVVTAGKLPSALATNFSSTPIPDTTSRPESSNAPKTNPIRLGEATFVAAASAAADSPAAMEGSAELCSPPTLRC